MPSYNLTCKDCGKNHNRAWNFIDSFGVCLNCGGELIRSKKRAIKQDMKAKQELKELGALCP